MSNNRHSGRFQFNKGRGDKGKSGSSSYYIEGSDWTRSSTWSRNSGTPTNSNSNCASNRDSRDNASSGSNVRGGGFGSSNWGGGGDYQKKGVNTDVPLVPSAQSTKSQFHSPTRMPWRSSLSSRSVLGSTSGNSNNGNNSNFSSSGGGGGGDSGG